MTRANIQVLVLLLSLSACGGGGGASSPPAGGAGALTGTWSLATLRDDLVCLGHVVGRDYDASVVQNGTEITAQIEGNTLVGSQIGTQGTLAGTVPEGVGYLTFSAQFTTSCGAAGLDGTMSWSYSESSTGAPVLCTGAATVHGLRLPVVVPRVMEFSPLVAPIDPVTGHQAPVLTDRWLTRAVAADGVGRIVIRFDPGTMIDESSIFIGGNPALGLDLSAVQFLHFTPGVGSEVVPLAWATVECDRITLVPEALAAGGLGLEDGQYSVGVFANVRNVSGDRLARATFHGFTVGNVDSVSPELVWTYPAANQSGVNPSIPTVLVRFTESIASESVGPLSLRVEDVSGPTPRLLPPAAGYPSLVSRTDGTTLPNDGFEVYWRGASVFPSQRMIQVTVVGLDQDPTGLIAVRDLSGNPLQVSHVFAFFTQ